VVGLDDDHAVANAGLQLAGAAARRQLAGTQALG
jgi:hypothetical protein